VTRLRRNTSGGQAMIEFLVSAAALVPLLVGVVIIGRLQDLRSHAQQSARYGAYARAFGTPIAETQSQIRTRFFGDPNTTVRERDARDGTRVDTTANAHWREPLRNVRALVSNAEDVVLVAAERAPAGRAGGLLETMAATADRVSSVSGGRFDVERRGYHEIAVRVRLADLSPAIGSGPLTLEARASVFGGDWSAGGPAQTAARATALAPATLIRRIRPVLAPIDWALAALEPAFRELCLGRVDAELVPADRLGPVGGGDAGTWVAPCP
jgi:hypothetical protein